MKLIIKTFFVCSCEIKIYLYMWIDEWMDGWMNELMNGWMDG